MTIWNSTCNPCFSTFDQIFFVFHGLKTVFLCYLLKLNFICYPNRFFTYDYSLWDGGDICFCGKKQTLIYIYVCGKCRTQFMLPMEKSVTFTGACANEIIPNG